MKTKIIFLLIFAASVAAQTDKPEANGMQHKKALLFSINEFRLESFNGGVGLKFWTSEGLALLGKINCSYSQSERGKTEKLTGNIETDISYGASLGFERHLNAAKNIFPYFGLSIGVGFENKNEKVNSADYLGTRYSNERTTSSYSLFANLSFGAEFFLTESISLAGQYNLGAGYSAGEEEYKTPYSATKMNVSDLNVGISSGALIIAVYF